MYADLFQVRFKEVHVLIPDGLPVHREVGIKIRLARIACGYTQQQLADATSCSVDTICRLERGKRLPDIAECQAIAAATRQNYDFFAS